jgi:orotate phosphoribosyltransferase
MDGRSSDSGRRHDSSEKAMNGGPRPEELVGLLAVRRGHFRLESGHHGDLGLDLDSLFLHPSRLRRFVAELAQRLSIHTVEAVCGPLVGGAFLAQGVAAELDVEFYYTERLARPPGDGLYAAEYRIPDALRAKVRDKNVAIVDDAINAGSAVRGTFADLRTCGARPVAIGALLVLGTSASDFAADNNLRLESIAGLPSGLWVPSSCPLCAAQVPLDDV